MGRMEVITRTERRRTFSEAEKATVVAGASVPGVTAREVADGYPANRIGELAPWYWTAST